LPRDRRSALKVALPLALLALAGVGVAIVWATRPEIEPRPPEAPTPLVRVVEVFPERFRFRVRTFGSVAPRSESELVPQVSGEVVWTSPALVPGGFFEQGEPLLRIDPRDYELEVRSANAALARADSEFQRARVELRRQRRLAGESVASQARIDDAENAYRVAEAALLEAQARLERAERDLTRTELGAPYEGRVRSEEVDVGQFVSRGQAVARLYAVDYAEVRLPVPDRDLRYLDLPLGWRATVEPAAGGGGGDGAGEGEPAVVPEASELSGGSGDDATLADAAVPVAAPRGPEVVLRTEFAGEKLAWRGRVVRTEGEIDPRSRMVNLVARVADPYARHEDADRPPLAVGLFVEAEILGRAVEDAYVLPRAALRRDESDLRGGRDVVHLVDEDERLRLREVEVLREESDRVVVGGGLEPGARVSVSPLRAVVDGMRVRIRNGEQAPSGRPADVAAAAGGES